MLNEWAGKEKVREGQPWVRQSWKQSECPARLKNWLCTTHPEECCNALGLSQGDAFLQVNFSAPAFTVIFHNPFPVPPTNP